MSERLEWQIVNDGGVSVVKLKGPISEDADFNPLQAELQSHGAIRFDMSGVGRINSCGVREWVNFVRALPGASKLELERCPPVVVAQINMISNFAGSARILSVFAPFVCDACGSEDEVSLQLTPGQIPDLGEVKCKSCGEVMEFDDVEDSYFAFITAS